MVEPDVVERAGLAASSPDILTFLIIETVVSGENKTILGSDTFVST